MPRELEPFEREPPRPPPRPELDRIERLPPREVLPELERLERLPLLLVPRRPLLPRLLLLPLLLLELDRRELVPPPLLRMLLPPELERPRPEPELDRRDPLPPVSEPERPWLSSPIWRTPLPPLRSARCWLRRPMRPRLRLWFWLRP